MPDPLLIGGSLIAAAAAAQAGWLAYDGIRRGADARTRRAREAELLAWRVEAARKRQAQLDDQTAWAGWRKFEVTRKVQESEDVCSFHLAPHDRKRLPRFRPGQHLTFQLPIPGRPKPIVRCYSLSDIPRPEGYRVSIKRLATSADRPDAAPGIASCFFHDHVKEGDILDVRAPSGRFCLESEAAGPAVFIAGGIGITPILAMLHGLGAGSEPAEETHVFVGLRHGRLHPFRSELARLTAANPKLRVHVCYSQPALDDVEGRDYDVPGHVDIDLIRRTLPSSNFRFYVCGPPPMMAALLPALAAWGVPAAHVRHEAFGAQSVKRLADTQERRAVGDEPIEVVFEQSGRAAMWKPADGTLLELAAAHGIALDAGCRAGSCGTCAVAVKAGDVIYRTKPGLEVETGTCLTCCSIPRSRLVLSA